MGINITIFQIFYSGLHEVAYYQGTKKRAEDIIRDSKDQHSRHSRKAFMNHIL